MNAVIAALVMGGFALLTGVCEVGLQLGVFHGSCALPTPGAPIG